MPIYKSPGEVLSQTSPSTTNQTQQKLEPVQPKARGKFLSVTLDWIILAVLGASFLFTEATAIAILILVVKLWRRHTLL